MTEHQKADDSEFIKVLDEWTQLFQLGRNIRKLTSGERERLRVLSEHLSKLLKE